MSRVTFYSLLWLFNWALPWLILEVISVEVQELDNAPMVSSREELSSHSTNMVITSLPLLLFTIGIFWGTVSLLSSFEFGSTCAMGSSLAQLSPGR